MLFRRKTILKRSLSVRHPKGARSIGIGHPRSGDRCTKTLPLPPRPLVGRRAELSATPPGCRTYLSVIQCDTLAGSRDCLHCPVHGSSGLRPSTRGYGAGTHKGCFVPHSSLLDEWLWCLSNASPRLTGSGLTFLDLPEIFLNKNEKNI